MPSERDRSGVVIGQPKAAMIKRVGGSLWLGSLLLITTLMLTWRPGEVAQAQTEPLETIRIATYNIQFLDANENPDRFISLKALIEAVDADVYALQEIDDRAALEAIFDPTDWQLVIDDESGDDQDLAVAVRAPLAVVGDLNADDEDFLFSDEQDFFFPNRRDVLDVAVQIPGVEAPVHILVVHLKSRFGGRNTTNPRRVGAAVKLLERLEQDFDETPFVLLGDFNDNPDDQALNILETGLPEAPIEIEDEPDDFLINLAEPLAAEGRVSNSIFSMAIDPVSGAIINIDVNSRDRNFAGSGSNQHTGNILFDQILIPKWMSGYYVPASATVFNGPENVGSSDHLPVYADFQLEAEVIEPMVDGVLIVELLPNPAGQDAGHESITLKNFGETAQDLSGWRLMDRSGHTFELNGLSLDPAESREIIIPVTAGGQSVLPLTNSGDDISLLNGEGTVVDSVSYTAMEATSGHRIVRGPADE